MWELERVPKTFEELQQSLEEQKKTLVAQLGQMSQELVSRSDEYTSRVLERQSLLDTVMAQIEEKRDQPAVAFLMDVGTILSSCEAAKAPIPEPVSPELQRSFRSLSEKCQQVVDMVDKFRGKALLALCCASLGWAGSGKSSLPGASAWGSGAKRLLQMGTMPRLGFAGAWGSTSALLP
ncbi:tripartite motif-containing protein 15-like isoform X1 [Motacilla alba alba]|uniref:tripartite motif-containing protein 15-like isoform X1 n=1 Tax=Motacilla alba alba TaxID=1094192 RepID=UPI0018D57535|nr:tripartite motif-containing protein 15-like isoform X1 [Motacilla alba alba]